MNYKIFGLIIVFLILLNSEFVVGEVDVGVKAGDWIRYNVATVGTPPQEHNVQWARMDILNVSGSIININVTTQAQDETVSSYLMIINLERGEIGAWFIIPKDLAVEDSFYDINYDRNFTIEGQHKLVIAGAERTVTTASTSERVKQWDKETGVFVSSIDTLPGYWINATAIETNMWGSQDSALNEAALFGVFILVIVAIVAIVIVFRHRHRS